MVTVQDFDGVAVENGDDGAGEVYGKGAWERRENRPNNRKQDAPRLTGKWVRSFLGRLVSN